MNEYLLVFIISIFSFFNGVIGIAYFSLMWQYSPDLKDKTVRQTILFKVSMVLIIFGSFEQCIHPNYHTIYDVITPLGLFGSFVWGFFHYKKKFGL